MSLGNERMNLGNEKLNIGIKKSNLHVRISISGAGSGSTEVRTLISEDGN